MKTIVIDNVVMYSMTQFLYSEGEVDNSMFERFLNEYDESFFLGLEASGMYEIVRYTHQGYDRATGAKNDTIEDIYVNEVILNAFKDWYLTYDDSD